MYVLDTGVMEDHEDLDGRVTVGKTIVGDDSSDTDGHGTFVAGVCCGSTYGVAKAASVVSVKTLDNDGNGRLSDLLKGLDWVVQQHNFTSAAATPTTTSSMEQPIATTTIMDATTIIPVVNGKIVNQNHRKNTTTTSPTSHKKGTTSPKRHSTKVKVTTTHKHSSTKSTSKAKAKATTSTHHQQPSHLVSSKVRQLHQGPVSASSSLTHVNGSSSASSIVSAYIYSAPSSSPSPSPSTSSSSTYSPSTQGKTKSIINLSLGALYNQVANDAVEQVIQLGIHVVVAAGNYGEDACLYSPGSAPGAITVGAIDRDDSIAYYSNFGKCVDM